MPKLIASSTIIQDQAQTVVVMSRTIIHMGGGEMDNYTVPGLQACSCNPCIQVCQDDSSQEHTEESPELEKVTTPAAVTT